MVGHLIPFDISTLFKWAAFRKVGMGFTATPKLDCLFSLYGGRKQENHKKLDFPLSNDETVL